MNNSHFGRKAKRKKTRAIYKKKINIKSIVCCLRSRHTPIYSTIKSLNSYHCVGVINMLGFSLLRAVRASSTPYWIGWAEVCAFVCVCWILLSFVSYRNRVLFFHRPIFDWNSRFEQTIHAFIIQFIHQQFSRLLTTSSTSHMSNIDKMNTYRYKRHAHTHTCLSIQYIESRPSQRVVHVMGP